MSKQNCQVVTSPKKQTDEFVLFPFLLFTANKSNSSVRFLGESTARQSAFGFYLTFIWLYVVGLLPFNFTYGTLLDLINFYPVLSEFLTWIYG